MLAITVRNLIVLIFLFTVLERTGVQLISFIKQFGNYSLIEFVDHPENTSKESGTEKDTLKELWIFTGSKTASEHISGSTSGQKLFINTNTLHSYYPAVPTPPPNRRAAYYLL